MSRGDEWWYLNNKWLYIKNQPYLYFMSGKHEIRIKKKTFRKVIIPFSYGYATSCYTVHSSVLHLLVAGPAGSR